MTGADGCDRVQAWANGREQAQTYVGRYEWVQTRCKMVNWLFTLGFPVQTNTDRSFLVVFEVVYMVRWYKYK